MTTTLCTTRNAVPGAAAVTAAHCSLLAITFCLCKPSDTAVFKLLLHWNLHYIYITALEVVQANKQVLSAVNFNNDSKQSSNVPGGTGVLFH
jgi:hypothetical protein